MRYKDNTTLGGYGIETTPHELSKIALCVADTGKWNNEQVIADDWIQLITSPQIPDIEGDYDFGFYCWIDKPKNISFMWGHGGQFALIVPSKELVVVMTAIPNTHGDFQIQAEHALEVIYKIIKIVFNIKTIKINPYIIFHHL